MKTFDRILLSIIFITVVAVLVSFTGKETIIGRAVNDFQLRSVNENEISLNSYLHAKGFIIVFTSNHCPFAKLYPKRLNDLNRKYSAMDVPLLAIRSTDTLVLEDDVFSLMKECAERNNFTFPFLADDEQVVAKDFNAQKTPHAYVIWREKGKWVIKYSGAIDDNGAEPEKVKHNYISEAVDALLAKKSVKVKETKSVGCAIRYR